MSLAILGGDPLRTRPFPSWPQYDVAEEQALAGVLRDASWGGYGKAVARLEQQFAAMHEVRFAVACSNGTVALEVALRAVGVKPGDEVIVTSFSFIASASCILLVGAIPVFADIDPLTQCISPAAIEAAITPRTRALIAVHFGGHPADMDAIGAISAAHNLPVIEDCAHAVGVCWRGKPVGNFGAVATFSFQSSKLATAGEGGMVVSNDPVIAASVWAECNQGRTREGQWYEHFTLGTNYRLTAFQAALLEVQLARLPEQSAWRTRNADLLREKLAVVEGIRTANPNKHVSRNPQYLMTLHYDPSAFSGLSKAGFLAAMTAEGIPIKPVYPHALYCNALFQSPRVKQILALAAAPPQDYAALHLEHCEQVCQDGLWIEHSAFMGPQEDMDDIVAALLKVQAGSAALQGKQAAGEPLP